MPLRTNIRDYHKIVKADDLKEIVKDKRTDKRATKQKAKQRNRRYSKTMLRRWRGQIALSDD